MPGKTSSRVSWSSDRLLKVLFRLSWVRACVSHVQSDTRLSRFSACNIEKLGVAWGRGYIWCTLNMTKGLLTPTEKSIMTYCTSDEWETTWTFKYSSTYTHQLLLKIHHDSRRTTFFFQTHLLSLQDHPTCLRSSWPSQCWRPSHLWPVHKRESRWNVYEVRGQHKLMPILHASVTYMYTCTM